MNLGLKDKVALVTGASSGIGKACALALAQEGCTVVICSRNEARIKTAMEEIGNDVQYLVADVGKKEDLEKLYNFVIDKFGRLDVLVNNTGGPTPGNYDQITEEHWTKSFNETLMSVVRLTQLVLPKMIEQKFGRIINITSCSVKEPIPRLLLSNTFRPAIAGYSKTVSENVAEHNVTINNILPGTIHSLRHDVRVEDISKNTGKTKEEVIIEMEQKIPMKRIGSPEEIGKVVAFIASEDASYITGSCIRVDGGRIRCI